MCKENCLIIRLTETKYFIQYQLIVNYSQGQNQTKPELIDLELQLHCSSHSSQFADQLADQLCTKLVLSIDYIDCFQVCNSWYCMTVWYCMYLCYCMGHVAEQGVPVLYPMEFHAGKTREIFHRYSTGFSGVSMEVSYAYAYVAWKFRGVFHMENFTRFPHGV